MALIDTFVEGAAPFAQPIPGDTPAGKDPAYEADFERVKLELDKLTSMSGGSPAWGDIIKLSEGLLKEKAKDLRLLVWLSVARMRVSGLSGLAEGMAITSQVCAAFWDGMYPDAKRGRARANLAGWLNDQSAAFLLELNPVASDGPPLEAIDGLYKSLDGLFAEKLGDLYPGMGALRSALRDKIRQVPAEAPPPPPPPPVSAEPAPAAAPAPSAAPAIAAAPSITGADDAVTALRAIGKSITEAARHLRKADPAQAWPYRLQRTGAWLVVRAAPPAEGKATRIPPPPADQRKKLDGQVSGEQWMELLNTAEDMTGTFLFWLDLQRLVAMAMDRLGALFLQARETVGREVVSFVTRYPAVVGLTFADGTPFADAATMSWLDQEQQKWGGASGGGGGSARASAEDEELAKRFEEAQELVGTGKIPEGLALAIQLASRGADARTRFRSRLSVAKLAIAGGKSEVARPILEGLAQEADAHRLEEWEPELCASLFSALASCIKPPSKPGADGGSWAAVFDRLCRLDPAAALKVSGS